MTQSGHTTLNTVIWMLQWRSTRTVLRRKNSILPKLCLQIHWIISTVSKVDFCLHVKRVHIYCFNKPLRTNCQNTKLFEYFFTDNVVCYFIKVMVILQLRVQISREASTHLHSCCVLLNIQII